MTDFLFSMTLLLTWFQIWLIIIVSHNMHDNHKLESCHSHKNKHLVTELSSITKWHIQFTVSYSVTAWPAVHHVTCGCALSSNFNHRKLSSHFVSYYPCRLFLSCFLSWAFLSSSVIFCISGGFFILGMCVHIDLCCLCLYRTTEWNSGKCSKRTPSNTNRSRLYQSSECTLKPEGEIDSRL